MLVLLVDETSDQIITVQSRKPGRKGKKAVRETAEGAARVNATR
jgi:hypothetical protein